MLPSIKDSDHDPNKSDNYSSMYALKGQKDLRYLFIIGGRLSVLQLFKEIGLDFSTISFSSLLQSCQLE